MNLNMPVSLVELFLYYIIPIVAIFIFHGIGWFLIFLFTKRKEPISAFSILTCSTLGLVSVVTVYSLIQTRGLTANWMILFLLLLYAYYNRGNGIKAKEGLHKSPIYKYLSIVFFINIIFFCYFFYRITDLEYGMFRPSNYDFDYYAKLSQYLNLGYENGLLEYNFFKQIQPQPYHYFEIWVNSLLYRFSGLNALIVYNVSLPMFFNTLIFLSLLSIVELRKKITIGYFIFSFVMLLLADIIPYLSSLFPVFVGWMPLLESPKLLPIFLFVLIAVVFILYGLKQEAYFTLLVIPVLNVISIVAIWGTIGVILLIDTIKQYRINWKHWFPFLSVIFLYLIYMINGGERSAGAFESFHWGLLRLYITQPIVYLFAYLHILLLVYLLDKKQLWSIVKKYGIIFFIAFFISTTISILMRPYNYDATQFVTGIITVFVYVAIVVISLIIITSIHFSPTKKKLVAFFCILSLFISVDVYKMRVVKREWSPEYESNILERLPSSLEEYRIGFYIGENVLLGEGGNYVSGVVDAVTIPDVLDYYYNKIYHYSINKGIHEEKWATDHTPYRDYLRVQKELNSTLTEDEIRLGFIKENKIEYIRIFGSASPTEEFLSHLILIANDSESGQRFYKVKHF